MSAGTELIKGLSATAGVPSVAATPPLNDNTTKVATTAFLRNEFTGTGKQVLSSTQGMQALPGGLILKWGSVTAVASGSSSNVTFTTPFPNAILNVSATIMNTGGMPAAMSAGAGSQTQNGLTVFHNGAQTATAISWFAIGY